MTAWKQLERDIARTLGGERRGPEPGSDVIHPRYSIEAKRQKRLALRATDLAQAKRQSKQDGKPWLLVLRAHHQRPVVVCDLATFAALDQGANP